MRTYTDEEFVRDDTVYYRRQNCKGRHGSAKVLDKEGQCALIKHGGAFYKMHPCYLMKANKEFRSPNNERNKTIKNEINEVLGEEDEGQCNKSLHINKEELKDNSKKPSRSKVVEYKMKGNDKCKKGKIMSAQPKLTGKYSHWLNIEPEVENENPVCINWDHVDQWRELPQVTEEVIKNM